MSKPIATVVHAHEIEHGRRLLAEGAEDWWGWRTPAGQRRAEHRTERILNGAHVSAAMDVLEVGCGTGGFTARFAERAKHVTAIDLSPDLIEAAKIRGLSNVTFQCVSLEAFQAPPFAAIIGSSVLHHIPDVRSALARLRDLLQPAGWLCFAEPNYLNPQVFLERTFRGFFPYVSPDETAFTKRGIGSLLMDIGFANVEVTPFDWLHPRTPAGLVRLVSAIGRGLERAPLISAFAGSLLIRAQKI